MKTDRHSQTYAEADALLRKGDPASIGKALVMLGQITASEPENAKAWFEFAGAFDFLGREAEAKGKV